VISENMRKRCPIRSAGNCLRHSVHNDCLIVSNRRVESDFPTTNSGRKFRISDRPMELHTERDRNVGIIHHLPLPCCLFTLKEEWCLSGEHQAQGLVRKNAYMQRL